MNRQLRCLDCNGTGWAGHKIPCDACGNTGWYVEETILDYTVEEDEAFKRIEERQKQPKP